MWDKKDTVGEHHSLDVRYLQRKEWLRPGLVYFLNWTRGGEPSGGVQVLTSQDTITLIYRHRRRGQEWEEVNQAVHLSWTPCNYGGRRFWFICGNCGRRVAVIYAGGKYFACRHCYDLTYRSCQESDSRFSWFFRNYNGLGGMENLPIWALKGCLSRAWKEEERLEKEIARPKKRRGRPPKGKPSSS